MTSLDNLEKLIQMATIEHMYSMLQKITNKSSETINQQDIPIVSSKYQNYDDIINNLTMLLNRTIIDNKKNTESIAILLNRVNQLEQELTENRSNTNNNSKYLCQQIRGQQVLTSYPGFSTSSISSKQLTKSVEEEHIKLKIEEKELLEDLEFQEDNENCDDHLELISEEKDEDQQSEEEVGTEDEEESVVVEEEVKEEEVVAVKEEVVEVEDEEIVAVEEVVQVEEVAVEEVVEEEEEEVEEEEEEEEVEEEEVEGEVEEEEEEEVFEIEIDDITYFATHEENGILYAITSDGDVGNKVGIIKDGEPIFN
jgi:hypothetical protein